MKRLVYIFVAIAAIALTLVIQQSPAPAQQVRQDRSNCESGYPDVCIPLYPPDLDCGEIEHRRFTVDGDDPHGFDGDDDGIGCESD